MSATAQLIGKTYDDLAIGDRAVATRIVTPDDFYVFAHTSGNSNALNFSGGQRQR